MLAWNWVYRPDFHQTHRDPLASYSTSQKLELKAYTTMSNPCWVLIFKITLTSLFIERRAHMCYNLRSSQVLTLQSDTPMVTCVQKPYMCTPKPQAALPQKVPLPLWKHHGCRTQSLLLGKLWLALQETDYSILDRNHPTAGSLWGFNWVQGLKLEQSPWLVIQRPANDISEAEHNGHLES